MITERLTLRALGATAPKARRLLPALLCGLLLATAVPTAAVAEPTTYVTTGPVFNNPKAPDTAGQNAILGHLGRLTGGRCPAPPSGSRSTRCAPTGTRASWPRRTATASTSRSWWTTPASRPTAPGPPPG
ncbi:hypothetical protein [Kitasatospora albolonga]|uniref:hypothetical protein n=1 Tax=Kitasatospora albolonga TaxID=68173 RepID=UPI0031EFD061